MLLVSPLQNNFSGTTTTCGREVSCANRSNDLVVTRVVSVMYGDALLLRRLMRQVHAGGRTREHGIILAVRRLRPGFVLRVVAPICQTRIEKRSVQCLPVRPIPIASPNLIVLRLAVDAMTWRLQRCRFGPKIPQVGLWTS